MNKKINFQSRSLYFNKIIDHGDHIEKYSVHTQKLRDEYHFLTSVPSELMAYYPKAFDFREDEKGASYKLVKLSDFDASHYLVCEESYQLDKILSILDCLKHYFKVLPTVKPSLADYQKSILRNIYVKNISRMREVSLMPQYHDLNVICREQGYQDIHDYCDSINQKLRESFLSVRDKKLHFSHGDLRFSNIFHIAEKVIFIDPKGHYGDITNTYRTIHYDLAKVSLSLMGKYDLINHDLFDIQDSRLVFAHSWKDQDKIENEFKEMLKDLDVEFSLVKKLEASLLLGLIPFHKDSEKKMLGLLIHSIKTFKEYSN